ncbi:Magnesium transporter mgtE [Aedoeadaptatus ivorii]|uniref:Magnesium transporter mgtE n=1 Tax=Aedoeadaptatus ivorii TaxID=54006 RepID=A0A3S4Z321_9FIRM|nr:magnesium transporter [Peptoniphilus ivorii]VEJ34674.1 Magnesium transporter mgtE [Peptoniphilus ivorii]
MTTEKKFDLMYRFLKYEEYEKFRDMFFSLRTNEQKRLFQSLYPVNKTRLTACLDGDELTRLFTLVEDTDSRPSPADSVFEAVKARVPWIVTLIFLGLISANLISFFEDTIEEVVALAIFMPIILDSAGNVGTQSLALAIRRLAFHQDRNQSFIKSILRELASGFFIGMAAFLAIGIVVLVVEGNLLLAAVVGTSILLTLTISAAIGYIIPTLFDKIGIDPAVASGPFITTLCDAFALIVYFGLATAVIPYL